MPRKTPSYLVKRIKKTRIRTVKRKVRGENPAREYYEQKIIYVPVDFVPCDEVVLISLERARELGITKEEFEEPEGIFYDRSLRSI
ncbi:unnamed protein product [marine sediment metagenome]|uniref:Uncharacterized protein n=1 Tax=marine sediment metagenome TaxID=412755 RepID=X1FWQ9_9ZZZZ|nr:MAG: hypothetical protein [uncultured archaeon]BDI55253.1 MAG: hypothetical protein [uncultured archaeon]